MHAQIGAPDAMPSLRQGLDGHYVSGLARCRLCYSHMCSLASIQQRADGGVHVVFFLFMVRMALNSGIYLGVGPRAGIQPLTPTWRVPESIACAVGAKRTSWQALQ